MSDLSWYQRKLASMRGAVAPAQAPRPFNYAQAPAPQQPTVWHDHSQAPPPEVPLDQLPLPQAWHQKLTRAALNGGQGERMNPEHCPECGSNQYFKNLPTSKRMPPPAGHCYNCGFNDGMFTQGMASAWEAAAPSE